MRKILFVSCQCSINSMSLNVFDLFFRDDDNANGIHFECADFSTGDIYRRIDNICALCAGLFAAKSCQIKLPFHWNYGSIGYAFVNELKINKFHIKCDGVFFCPFAFLSPNFGVTNRLIVTQNKSLQINAEFNKTI